MMRAVAERFVQRRQCLGSVCSKGSPRRQIRQGARLSLHKITVRRTKQRKPSASPSSSPPSRDFYSTQALTTERSRPYHKDKLSGLRLGFVFFWARLAGLADDFFPRVLWADHRDLCSIKNKAVWPKPGRFPLPNPSDEAAKATAATTSFWDLFFRCRLLPLFVNQPPHSTVCAHYKFSNIARNSGHVCAGTERPAGSTKLMVHDLFASQGGERVWFAG